MASIVAKQKDGRKYYYVVESARVNGKPRVVSQVYLGTAEKVAGLVKDRSAPVPLSATCKDFGLPGALWLAAQRSGVFDALKSLWPEPRSGPSTAHYLLLAAIHRICDPGPKTEVSDWYERTILHQLWGVNPDRFSSQAFWDCFDGIQVPDPDNPDYADSGDDLTRAQSTLLGLWKNRDGFGSRFLAYDTTNFYTFIASTNNRNRLAQRGHNKQGRHNLRQVGLSYVMDGETGLGVCYHLYPGSITDTVEFSSALPRIVDLLDRNQIKRESVTLVFDKGTSALANTVQLEESGLGWICALPWNQAPAQLRDRPIEEIPKCTSQPSVRAVAEKHIVHGREYLCVLKYSPTFATEQLHSVSTSLAKALQNMTRLSKQLSNPKSKFKELAIHRKISKWLEPQFISDLITFQLVKEAGRFVLLFELNQAAVQDLLVHRLGRTVFLTNRMAWTADQVVAGYSDQQQVERAFRGLKDGNWLNWGPMYHWTDHNIQVHAFYCMLGISLLRYVQNEAWQAWPGISVDELIAQLDQIKQFVLLYPRLGERGPDRTAKVLSKHSLVQQSLITALGLDQISSLRR